MFKLLLTEGARTVISFIDVGNHIEGLRGCSSTPRTLRGRCRGCLRLPVRGSHLLLLSLLLSPSSSFRYHADGIGHTLHRIQRRRCSVRVRVPCWRCTVGAKGAHGKYLPHELRTEDVRASLAHAVVQRAALQQRLQHAVTQTGFSTTTFHRFDTCRRGEILRVFWLQWRREAWASGPRTRSHLERSLDIGHCGGERGPKRHDESGSASWLRRLFWSH